MKKINCLDCDKEILVDKRCDPKRTLCIDCREKRYKLKNNNELYGCKACGKLQCNKEHYFCKRPTIKKALVNIFGFDKNKIGTLEALVEFDRIKNEVEYRYFILKKSTIELGKEYGLKFPDVFNSKMKMLGINRRNFSDARNEAICKNKIKFYKETKYKQSWHTSWDNKKVFFRSSYELDYAKKLDNEKIEYEVEKIKIIYWSNKFKKNRVAIVDFYLPKNNLLIEIKSDYTLDIEELYEKVTEYQKRGYNFKLILNKKEEYGYEWLKSKFGDVTKLVKVND